MARVTINLSDEIGARRTAKTRGTTVARWIAEQVTEKPENAWSPDVLSAIGSFPDFPDLESLRRGYGKESAREGLNRRGPISRH